ncbi:MAG: hypothetical protein HKO56_09125 [Bacteroidia bacterium]|nr:hypothetical protein [Bacteroidia bacterium]NNC86046.1 hypothetical protein [Bacteroidia bacterium]NNM16807.1 hypothetical protein [Bacteroidia bacterium]
MEKSDYLFIVSAFLSFVLSVYLWFSGQKEAGLYVGIWVPSLLSAATLIKTITNKQIQS